MANKIRVNTNRNEGSIQGSSVTQGDLLIVREIRRLRSALTQDMKKNRSFGAGFLGRSVGGIAAGVGAATTAVGGLLNPGSEALPGTVNSETSFEKLVDNKTGAITVAETNRKSGEILRYLTEEEAIRAGILDEAGNLKQMYADQSSKFDELNKQTTTWKDGYFVDIDTHLKDWNENAKKTAELQEKIKNALEEAGVEAGKLPGIYREAQRPKRLPLLNPGDFEGQSATDLIGLIDRAAKGQLDIQELIE